MRRLKLARGRQPAIDRVLLLPGERDHDQIQLTAKVLRQLKAGIVQVRGLQDRELTQVRSRCELRILLGRCGGETN